MRESVVGPYVTIESGCRVERSVLTDCILDHDVAIKNQIVERALLGARVAVTGTPLSVSLGDDSTVSLPDSADLPTL